MAQKRMFSLKIVDTDEFLDMPPTTQNLYFHLCMRADDDGFVSNPRKIMKIVNSGNDDLKVLTGKRFVIPFESGICVIKHWKIHNLIRLDRYTETEYKEEKEMLIEQDKKYELNNGKQNVIPSGNPVKVRLDKIRLDKISITEQSSVDKKEVDELIELFKEVNPSYKKLFGNKTERKSMEELFKQQGREKIEWLIKILPKTNSMPYSPTITTPYVLQIKLGQLIAFIQKEKIKVEDKKIIKI